MAKTQILEYTIHLTDQAQVDAYNASLAAGTGPGTLLQYYSPTAQALVYGVLRAPSTGAAIEFSAPFQLDTEPFLAPCTRSPWFTNGANFPTNVATFTRKSGGWFGIPILFGSTTRFYWVGRFVYAPPSVETPGDPPSEPPPVLLARRWIDGFELPHVGSVQTGEGGTSGSQEIFRDASRVTCDGLGYGSRSRNSNLRTHLVMENRGGGTSNQKTSWERFYFRVKRLPSSGEADVWFGYRDSSNNGVKLRVAADGRLLVYNFVNSSAVLIGSGPIVTPGTWYKYDVIFGVRGVTPAFATNAPVGNGPGNLYLVGEWVVSSNLNYRCIIRTDSVQGGNDNSPTDQSGAPHWTLEGSTEGRVCSFRLYINGAQVIDLPAMNNTVGATAGEPFHSESRIGPVQVNDAELDFDSWISVDCPNVQQPWDGVASQNDAFPDYETLETQLDFIAGTHVQLVRPNGSIAQTNWTGVWQLAKKRMVDNLDAAANYISSSTSGALLHLSADVSPTYLLEGATGIGAAIVAVFYHRAGAGTPGNDTIAGVLSLDTDADGVEDFSKTFSASVAVPAANVQGWRNAFYDGAGYDVAPKLLSMALKLTHGADVIDRRVHSLHATVELIGIFGPEDMPADSIETRAFPVPDPHFTNQPFSPWARTTGPRFGAAVIISDTYVGTGAPFNLAFPLPVTFLWIRRASGTNAQMSGFRYWPSMFTGNLNNCQQPISPWVIAEVARDNAFPPAAAEDAQEVQWHVQILTADDKVNESGVTYNYTAICDPAARYVRCGSTWSTDLQPVTVPLLDPEFTPLAGFFYPEDRGNNSSALLAYKGPSHTARTAHNLAAGTVLTEMASFGAGEIVIGTDLEPSGADSCPFVLFRLDDGNGEAPIFQHATYVGNGVNPRTIALTPLFGVRPVFGIVIGTGASSDCQRDTSHTGTTSQDIGAGSSIAANGIAGGGIDQVIVGSQVNANGVTYHVFVLPGDATAGQNGWGVAGEYYVSEPDSALDDDWIEPIEVEEEDDDDDTGDGDDIIPPDLEDDLDDPECVLPTHNLINSALQRIGINIPIDDVLTENSAEAAAIRLAYDETLQETLRRLPWPFATRYSALTLSSGSAGNAANVEWQYTYDLPQRCIFPRRVVAERGEAVDPTAPPFREAGGIIMTNQEDANLEYTARTTCPARVGDAMFRNAWCWRMAAAIAPALTRIPGREEHCLNQFEHSIAVAKEVLRLGNPGLRPGADATDPDLATQAAKLHAINVALMRIGAKTVADLATEQSREVNSALLVYEDELRSTLRDFPWPFATRYDEYNDAAGDLVLVTGSEETPATPDHLYAYRTPEDAIFVRRLVKARDSGGGTRQFDPNPITFIMGSDDDGGLILTDDENAIVEYTIRPPNIWNVADSQFKDACCWRLAAALAPAVAVPDPEKEEQTGQAAKTDPKDPRHSEGGRLRLQQLRMERARWAWAMYERALEIAKGSAGNEVQREKDGDASWITDRTN